MPGVHGNNHTVQTSIRFHPVRRWAWRLFVAAIRRPEQGVAAEVADASGVPALDEIEPSVALTDEAPDNVIYGRGMKVITKISQARSRRLSLASPTFSTSASSSSSRSSITG